MSINVEEDKVRVHQTHCCVLHGCKYGHDDDGCPVETGKVVQEFICEYCDDEGIESVGEAKALHFEEKYCQKNFDYPFSSELLEALLLGKMARVKPAYTDLDPDPGFEIHKIKLHDNRIFVRGEHTDWFGESQFDLLEEE